jgi:hypothetical protein
MATAFRECASDERREGRTILLASHLLAGPESLADRVTAIPQWQAGRDRHASGRPHVIRYPPELTDIVDRRGL